MARGYSTHWIVLEKGMLGWVLSLFFYVDLHYIHDMDFSAFLSYYHDQNNEGKTLRGSIVNIAAIEKEANFQEKEAHSTFGMLSGDDPAVAPLRRALAVWGLNIDVIGVASVRLSMITFTWHWALACVYLSFLSAVVREVKAFS